MLATIARVVILVNSIVAKRFVESLVNTIEIVIMNKIIIDSEERTNSKYEPAAHVLELEFLTPIPIAGKARI